METIYRTFHPVRKTVLLTPVVILVLMLSANFQQAQAQTTNSVQTATLKTTGQSMFNTGPASPINSSDVGGPA
jgi:PBP1b-binding outer membrane lipoprotein LpoB